MKEPMDRAEDLRLEGMSLIRQNRIEESLPVFDQALDCAENDELGELITINKAGALISLERSGREVQLLPQVILRRRSPRNVYVAAYNLQHKFQIEKDYKRAASYARVALSAAEEAEQPEWKVEVLFALGNLAVYESQITDAIDYFEQVLAASPAEGVYAFRHAFTLQNLGYSRLMNHETAGGIALIHQAIERMRAVGASGYVPESYIDLCFGYLEMGELDLARQYGEMGLAESTEVRQVRNAHYLLGEICYKQGDVETAETHFDTLAKFYPDFPNLKNLLLAIDLRALVNLKL